MKVCVSVSHHAGVCVAARMDAVVRVHSKSVQMDGFASKKLAIVAAFPVVKANSAETTGAGGIAEAVLMACPALTVNAQNAARMMLFVVMKI